VHSVCIDFQCRDLSFEEREKLMSFYEAISGARMHSGFLRLGGISVDVPLYLFDQIYK